MKFNVGLKFRRLEAVRNLVFVQTFPFREVFVLLMAAGYTFRTYTISLSSNNSKNKDDYSSIITNFSFLSQNSVNRY